MKNIIRWLKYKGWFLLDLPLFLKEKGFRKGLELGAKGGRSMYYALRKNPQLHLTGIDLWEVMEGSAYKNNDKKEAQCRKKLKRFKDQVHLIKGDANDICHDIKDGIFDFILYELQRGKTPRFHQKMIQKWIPKIKKGGGLIGRDFRTYRDELYALGFKESDFKRCSYNNKPSERLEYLTIK